MTPEILHVTAADGATAEWTASRDQ